MPTPPRRCPRAGCRGTLIMDYLISLHLTEYVCSLCARRHTVDTRLPGVLLPLAHGAKGLSQPTSTR